MRSASQWIERCLWTIGFLTLAACLAVWIGAKVRQARGERELDRRLGESPVEVTVPRSKIPLPKLSEGDLVGRIAIPRLKLSTVIFEGTDSDVLRDGVGHLMGSALPGQAGNVVLAAHRDSFFRPLQYVHDADTIDVTTPSGTRTYQVVSTSIVTPDDVGVLAPTHSAELTLVTCYPFDWFGHAPKRFIVRAREIDNRESVAVSSTPPPEPPADAATQAAAVMEDVDREAPPPPKVIHHPPRRLHHFKPYVPIVGTPAAS